MYNAPHHTELNEANAREYAEWLASIFGTTADRGQAPTFDTDPDRYTFRLLDGTSASVWLEDGKLYGEA